MVVNKEYYNKLVKSWALRCEDEVRSWKLYDQFILNQIKLDWSPRRTSHLGGWYDGPGISMAMDKLARPRTTPYRFYEYKSYDSNSSIGGFFAVDPELYIKTAVTHEVAHAAQFFADRILGIPVDRGHGISFKKPYKLLRDKLINPLIPLNQKQLSTEYQELVKSTIRNVNWIQLDF